MKCKAFTKKRKQCTRTGDQDGYCFQHRKMYVREVPSLASYPPGRLVDVPEPPEDLKEAAASRFKHYCMCMIEEDRLKGVYLHGLHEMCRLEQDLEELREELKNEGRYNVFVNDEGNRNIQNNGIAAAMNQTQVRIEKLRQYYGFVPQQIKAGRPSTKAKPVPLRKIKNF